MSNELIRFNPTVRVKSADDIDFDSLSQAMTEHLYAVLPSHGGEPIGKMEMDVTGHVHASGDYSCPNCREWAADEQS